MTPPLWVTDLAEGFWADVGQREPFPRTYELYGPNNVAAATDVWRAAMQWFDENRLIDIEPQYRKNNDAPLSQAIWTELWKPYWLAKRRIPHWLPLVPTRNTLDDL